MPTIQVRASGKGSDADAQPRPGTSAPEQTGGWPSSYCGPRASNSPCNGPPETSRAPCGSHLSTDRDRSRSRHVVLGESSLRINSLELPRLDMRGLVADNAAYGS